MKPTARSSRLVSGTAVAAVCVAALAAMWADGGPGQQAARLVTPVDRPAADGPVRVVRAPRSADAQRQPASCGDCPTLQLRERSL